jgi:fumarate hydratase class II
MNITLSVDKELVKRAREYAAQHGTSLNQIIREYMEQFSSVSNVLRTNQTSMQDGPPLDLAQEESGPQESKIDSWEGPPSAE